MDDSPAEAARYARIVEQAPCGMAEEAALALAEGIGQGVRV